MFNQDSLVKSGYFDKKNCSSNQLAKTPDMMWISKPQIGNKKVFFLALICHNPLQLDYYPSPKLHFIQTPSILTICYLRICDQSTQNHFHNLRTPCCLLALASDLTAHTVILLGNIPHYFVLPLPTHFCMAFMSLLIHHFF